MVEYNNMPALLSVSAEIVAAGKFVMHLQQLFMVQCLVQHKYEEVLMKQKQDLHGFAIAPSDKWKKDAPADVTGM